MNPLRNSSPRDLDQQIDRALTVLKHTHARQGLESRVLRSVERHQGEQHAANRSFPLLPARLFAPRMPWFSVAFAALLLLGAGVTVFVSRRPSAPAVAATAPPDRSQSRVTSPGPLVPPATANQTWLLVTRHPLTRNAATATHAQAEAAAEDRDHPAPELPLTDQERSLVRFARGPDSPQQQLAMLHRSGMRVRPPVEDDTDFNSFFEPYTLPLTEGDPR